MKVKVIALKRIHKTEPGGELELPSEQANVLVLLGKARLADAPEKAPAPEKPKRGRPRRGRTGAVGAVTQAAVTPAEEKTNEPDAAS